MKKRMVSLLLLVTLVLLMLPGVTGAGALFFVGVNDSVPMYLSAAEAPYYKNGQLYAPYTVLNAGAGGIAVSYNADKESLALFTRAKRLVYDLNAGTLTDENQKTSKVECVFKNGTLFIPINKAASHFGLSVTLLTGASSCPILRLTDGSQTLDNETFIKKSATLINIILEQEESNAAGKESGEGKQEEPQTDAGPATVYFAVASDAVSRQTLQMLNDWHISATFFVTAGQIAEQKDLLRDIYASGHQIGLTVEEGETDYAQALQLANEALDNTLFFKTVLALLPGNAPEQPQYAVFREWAAAPIETVLEKKDAPQLFVCRADAAFVLPKLRAADAQMPLLLETSQIPGVSTK